MRENSIYKKDNYDIEKYNIIGIDIENNPVTGEFINCGIVSKNDEKYFEYQDEMNDYIVNELDIYGNKLSFFNLSYDKFFFRDIINDANILRSQSNVIQINLDEAVMIDLRNIVDGSLEKWIELLDMPKKYGVSKVDFSDMKLRVMNDAKATYILGEYLQDYFNNQWNITMKNTIGSNAVEIFKCNYLKNNIVRKIDNDIVPDFERESLRGGRNEIFKRGYLDVISYDVRSMYLSIMRDCLIPIPTMFRYSDNPKNYRTYLDNYLCILDVSVKVPYSYITPLPLNVKVDGISKIIFPYGTFRGVYTSVELLNAERYGLEILECHRILYYYKKEKLFYDFANDVWQKRLKHNTQCLLKCPKCNYTSLNDCPYSLRNPDFNKPLDTMNKKVGNSLYGKWSQHIPIVSYYGRESQLPEAYKPILKDDVNYNVQLFNYFDEVYIDVHSKKKIDSKFTFTCMSSFITSYARIKLYNEAKPIEKYVVYFDTDSIKILNQDGAYINNGKDLGDFMMEYNKREMFYAPKFYGSKTKGIPKSGKIISIDEDKGIIEYKINKPYKYRSAIRQNKKMGVWDYFGKTISLQDDKRIWFGTTFFNQGTESKPYYINDKYNLSVSINTKNI